MRILGGVFRGRKLYAPSRGAGSLRPTSSRVRGSIFDVLVNGRAGDLVTGNRVLDLFAGSGALGIEALSRGASHAIFVDNSRDACGLTGKNLGLVGVMDRAEVLLRDARRLGRPGSRWPFDLVFLDPPYGRQFAQTTLRGALAGGWLGPHATVVIEDHEFIPLPDGFKCLASKSHGDTCITVGMREK